MSTDVLEQMRETFRSEALDLLIELDSSLLELEGEPSDLTLVHRVFRAIHTIKGSGATAGFAHLARFAHKMEEAFDLAREGRLAVSPELIDCGLKACDVLRQIIEDKAEDSIAVGEQDATTAFTRLLATSEKAPSEADGQSKPVAEVRAAFEVVFKPNRQMFYSGSDPVTLLDDLRELGQAHITAHVDQVPPLPSLEAENCYIWWEILLVTSRDLAAIRDVFIFVADECELRIQLRDDQAAAVALLGSVPPEAFELFVVECEELLLGIEADALALETDLASRDRLDSLFRGVHSIKGSVGLLLGHVQGASLVASHPLQLLLRVAHGLESLLDPFRAAAAGPVSKETIQTSLETCDTIRAQLSSLTHHGAAVSVSPALLQRLGIRSEAGQIPAVAAANGGDAAFLSTTSQCVEIIQSCFRRLEDSSAPATPILETYLRGLKTLSAAAQYRDCTELEEPVALQLQIVDAAMRTGTFLSIEDRSRLSEAFRKARSVVDGMSQDSDVTPVFQTAVNSQTATKNPVEDRPVAPASASTIRIEQNKLDRLMRVVGELLVARGAFPLLIQKLNDGADGRAVVKDLKEAGSNISRISDDLQTTVMSIRMLPIKTVFQKFPRLVRDLARSLGKEVRLVVEGEGIELDKTILEQIGDPLVHVIRNSVDHGFEMPEERLAKGKERSGQLTLRAFHETGGVAIEVTDDGKGLDAAALKRKAIDKGLLTAEAAAAMTDEAAFQLVFLPGLSTAAKVTDVSGRGVGMDVVRSNVRNLQGTIEIRSERGAGTTMRIKLPTSLMISKGILLEAGTQEYILPLTNIRDMVKLSPEAVHQYQGQSLAQVRGTIYSIFNLANMLGVAQIPNVAMGSVKSAEVSVAIVESGAVRYGLVVDKFLTEVEVLVKPLAGGLGQCKEFQGAAIMGDGRVVLVLNALECHSLNRTECT
jgi:two-component system chemotaxis sensor kinase CheA